MGSFRGDRLRRRAAESRIGTTVSSNTTGFQLDSPAASRSTEIPEVMSGQDHEGRRKLARPLIENILEKFAQIRLGFMIDHTVK